MRGKREHMPEHSRLQGASGIALGAIAALAVALAALVLYGRPGRRDAEPQAALLAPEEVAAQGAASALATESARAPDTPTTPRDTVPVLPSFDIVRADPGGETLVAGSGAPGERIELMIDGRVAETVQADTSGRFVSFLSMAPSDQPRVLSLRTLTTSGAQKSLEEVILAPTAQSALIGVAAGADSNALAPDATTSSMTASVAQADKGSGDGMSGSDTPLPEPATVAESLPVTDLPAVPQTASTAPVGPAETSSEGQLSIAPVLAAEVPSKAPAVILSSRAGIDVLQPQSDSAGPPVAQSDVALDAITYGSDGGVVLSGRGNETEAVRIYLDNRPAGAARVGALYSASSLRQESDRRKASSTAAAEGAL